MRVALLSTWLDYGGAARACQRLNDGLRTAGVRSDVVALRAKHGAADALPSLLGRAAARVRPHLDQLPRRAYRGSGQFSPGWLPGGLDRHRLDGVDLVHVHWVQGGFLGLTDLAALPRPLIWTAHDMWPMTGGCHYDDGCERWQTACGSCPALGSHRDHDLAHALFRKKAQALRSLPLTLITPSRWLADCAARSPVLAGVPVYVIPNGVDLVRFQRRDRAAARSRLGLPADGRIVLTGAAHPAEERRKGFHLFVEALRVAAANGPAGDVSIAVFGALPAGSTPPTLPLPARYFGSVDSDALVDLYSAADVFCAPSVQDNLPNTVVEALACGTPCVAFDIGGMPDLIVDAENGRLVRPFDVVELGHALRWVLADDDRHDVLSRNARAKAERDYDLVSMARRHVELYEAALERHRGER